MKPDELKKLLSELNVSLVQLPKIDKKDPMLPEGCNEGDLIKIERKSDSGINLYYRVVV